MNNAKPSKTHSTQFRAAAAMVRSEEVSDSTVPVQSQNPQEVAWLQPTCYKGYQVSGQVQMEQGTSRSRRSSNSRSSHIGWRICWQLDNDANGKTERSNAALRHTFLDDSSLVSTKKINSFFIARVGTRHTLYRTGWFVQCVPL